MALSDMFLLNVRYLKGGYEVWFSQQYMKRTGPYVEETEDLIHEVAHRNLGIRI